MVENFIKELMNIINTIKPAYYEEAPNNAIFPYLVVPTLTITPLNAGYSSFVDIEVHSEQTNNESPEKIIDIIKNTLDGYNFYSKDVSFYLGLDDIYSGKASDQDLLYKRITFEARIF